MNFFRKKEEDIEALNLPLDFEDVLKRLDGDKSKGGGFSLANGVKTENILPISAKITADEKAAHKETEAEAAFKNLQPGKMVVGQGIYLGKYQPKDHTGKSLKKTFNVFAAPQDLTGRNGKRKTRKYNDTVKHISKLKDWNGHNGTKYTNDKEIYKALEDGSYNGGWIIPQRELLTCIKTDEPDIDGIRKGNIIQPDNLFDHRNKGAFKDTFETNSNLMIFDEWYWSSTENNDDPSKVWNARFSDGCQTNNSKNRHRLSCRPIRLVEISPPAPR